MKTIQSPNRSVPRIFHTIPCSSDVIHPRHLIHEAICFGAQIMNLHELGSRIVEQRGISRRHTVQKKKKSIQNECTHTTSIGVVSADSTTSLPSACDFTLSSSSLSAICKQHSLAALIAYSSLRSSNLHLSCLR